MLKTIMIWSVKMKIGYKVVKKNKSTKPIIWEVVGESNVSKRG